MATESLRPQLALLREEYVLVQAWKKTSSYMRYHNWYADTLELDRATVNLPRFLAKLAQRFREPEQWVNAPLRIVPAPKSQQWKVTPGSGKWGPVNPEKAVSRLRPLAHASLEDQVAATALMLCIADRVESLQGDPRMPLDDAEKRKQVISYGSRLFCDASGSELRHRWGSSKLYRAYYQDYRRFLSRPEIVADGVGVGDRTKVVIVHSDLRQFFDRVRPNLLADKLCALARPDDDPGFFALATQLFNWEWHPTDAPEVAAISQKAYIPDFSRVALPQGLVAAGFFANVTLLDFDQSLREAIAAEIAPGIRLEDASRYVDDLRLVMTVSEDQSLTDVEELTTQWLQGLLSTKAPGMEVSREKTRAAVVRGDERPLVRQSRKMARIQGAVSGGFDAIGGEEILDAIQGLIRSQQRYSERRTREQGWPFSPIPDVRDSTVARFAAARFRTTYRSLRPLLEDHRKTPDNTDDVEDGESAGLSRVARTRDDLDDEARAFALGLIENWIEDPSNVRLLRIGLDLWPADDILSSVLELLRPFTERGGRRKEPRRVAWYCLAEIFRAGATETGFVDDGECLPDSIDISAYRRRLLEEAIRLSALPPRTLPWYLKQQILLFLAANDATRAPIQRAGHSPETKHYRELLLFLKGEVAGLRGPDYATLAVLARRSFLDQEGAVELLDYPVSPAQLEEIARRDPSFALEILNRNPNQVDDFSPRLRDDLALKPRYAGEGWLSLAQTILSDGPNNLLRNERAILSFASQFIEALLASQQTDVVTPSDVVFRLAVEPGIVAEVKLSPSRVPPTGSMYQPPPWCSPTERWRFQLGYLLRYILTARPDFTQLVREPHGKERTPTYRVPASHWYQRLYGLFNGHSAFGDDWLPVSGWTEQLLFALLRWPGCLASDMPEVRGGPGATKDSIDTRLQDLSEEQGPSRSVLMLRLPAPRPVQAHERRPLRACVVQTVIPGPGDFPDVGSCTVQDVEFSDPAFRRRHRNHLSAALAAIDRMLDLRETHKGSDGRLDWLILPELSVHPSDVKTHLLPFARAHKAIILAGLTYQALTVGRPLTNSALWIIPQWTKAHGLQVLLRRQGKHHLSPDEEKYNATGSVLGGFRPCQWLIGYDWSDRVSDPLLWLTASICYDATDITLAADLRSQSDVFAVPALNKDVNTFDQMALALHYHMFQLVIVANNGVYGGSNAYLPLRETYRRQVFHLHGQPQASIAFLEIDDIGAFLARKTCALANSTTSSTQAGALPWKFPPAGI